MHRRPRKRLNAMGPRRSNDPPQKALLGVIPLQSLGLELDLQNERIVVLPDTGPGTYLSIQ